MQFNSYIFIFALLPLSLIAYHLLNRVNALAGKLVLIASSLLFYAWGDWSALLILGISVVLNYCFALLLSRDLRWKKLALFFPLLINIGLLFYFKYWNFAILNIDLLFGKSYGFRDIVQQSLAGIIQIFTFSNSSCIKVYP